MATVESWFLRFTQSVTRRLPRADWPPPTDEFWDEFRRFLVRHGAGELDAKDALSLLAEEPPKFVGDLIPEFKKALQSVWKRSEVEGAGSRHGTFAEAQSASRNCRDCGGSGFIVVHHKAILRSLAAVCECAAGRWQFDRLTRDEPTLAARLVRLLEVKSDMTDYVVDRPDRETLTDDIGTPLPEVWKANASRFALPRITTTLAREIEQQNTQAVQFIVGYLLNKEQPYHNIIQAADELKISRTALGIAKQRVGILERQDGDRQLWSLPERVAP